jgi:hypothetical protein
MRLAVPIAIVVLAAALAGGCGGSGSESESNGTGTTAAPQGGAAPAGASAQSCGDFAGAEAVRATGVSCAAARPVVVAWTRDDGCVGSQGISHVACTVRSYRCIATRTERGLSVSCAGPGRSLAFTSKR